jgi:hypothetical protein
MAVRSDRVGRKPGAGQRRPRPAPDTGRRKWRRPGVDYERPASLARVSGPSSRRMKGSSRGSPGRRSGRSRLGPGWRRRRSSRLIVGMCVTSCSIEARMRRRSRRRANDRRGIMYLGRLGVGAEGGEGVPQVAHPRPRRRDRQRRRAALRCRLSRRPRGSSCRRVWHQIWCQLLAAPGSVGGWWGRE